MKGSHASAEVIPGPEGAAPRSTTPVPWDDIDPGIAGVVRTFIENGFETIASCQGHGGGGDAWVVVLPDRRSDLGSDDAFQCAYEVERLLYATGWDRAATIAIKWVVTREPVREHYVEVRWWGEVPFR